MSDCGKAQVKILVHCSWAIPSVIELHHAKTSWTSAHEHNEHGHQQRSQGVIAHAVVDMPINHALRALQLLSVTNT